VSDWLEDPSNYLRTVAAAYANNALRAYLKVEGNVSFVGSSDYATSAEAVCGLARCVEHLLKLRLWQEDSILIFPMVKKHVDYLILKGTAIPGMGEEEQSQRRAQLTAKTITFREALEVARMLSEATDFPWDVFEGLYGLRNSLEHGWRPNKAHLQRFFGILSTETLPALQRFVAEELHLEHDIFSPELLKDVKTLDRAHQEGHSLATQKRLEFFKKHWAACVGTVPEEYQLPGKYLKLSEYESSASCPVCGACMDAFWDWEPDYDDEPVPTSAYPDAKCLSCAQCGFYVDGADVANYLPEGIPIEDIVDYDDDYRD